MKTATAKNAPATPATTTSAKDQMAALRSKMKELREAQKAAREASKAERETESIATCDKYIAIFSDRIRRMNRKIAIAQAGIDKLTARKAELTAKK